MSRIKLRMAFIVVLAMTALGAGSAQASTGKTLLPSRVSRAAVPTGKKAPKPTDYLLCAANGCDDFTIQLFKKTHTWDFDGYSEYGGSYVTSGKELVLRFEDGADGGDYVVLEKGKKNTYAGDAYYPDGQVVEEWLLTKE